MQPRVTGMAKRSLNEQLDAAVEAFMAHPDAPLPKVHPRLAALLRVAADLRHLPRSDFKVRLQADLATPPAGVARATHPSRRSPKKGPRERKWSLKNNPTTARPEEPPSSGGPSTALRTGVSKGARLTEPIASPPRFQT